MMMMMIAKPLLLLLFRAGFRQQAPKLGEFCIREALNPAREGTNTCISPSAGAEHVQGLPDMKVALLPSVEVSTGGSSFGVCGESDEQQSVVVEH